MVVFNRGSSVSRSMKPPPTYAFAGFGKFRESGYDPFWLTLTRHLCSQDGKSYPDPKFHRHAEKGGRVFRRMRSLPERKFCSPLADVNFKRPFDRRSSQGCWTAARAAVVTEGQCVGECPLPCGRALSYKDLIRLFCGLLEWISRNLFRRYWNSAAAL